MTTKVLRAGTRVRLTSEGAELFPADKELCGELLGYNDPTTARVLFEGRDTPIEVPGSFLEPAEHAVSQRQKNLAIRKNRKLLRAAYDLIRHNPAEQALRSNLAHALGGSAPVTPTLLDTAQQIVTETANGSAGTAATS
jgi:hypothetical protein